MLLGRPILAKYALEDITAMDKKDDVFEDVYGVMAFLKTHFVHHLWWIYFSKVSLTWEVSESKAL